jgi:hypothetical protein
MYVDRTEHVNSLTLHKNTPTRAQVTNKILVTDVSFQPDMFRCSVAPPSGINIKTLRVETPDGLMQPWSKQCHFNFRTFFDEKHVMSC